MESLLTDGSLRIGTLYEYRKTDKYGELVGDADEGTKRLDGRIKEGKTDLLLEVF
jgi:hypothetical protein